MQMMRFEALDDTHAVRKMMCLSLKCTRVTQLLLLLLKHYMLASPVSHLSAASGFLQDIYLLRDLHIQLVSSVGLFSGNKAALVFDELQWLCLVQMYSWSSVLFLTETTRGSLRVLQVTSYLLRDLHIQLVSSVGLFSGNKAALVFDELQWLCLVQMYSWSSVLFLTETTRGSLRVLQVTRELVDARRVEVAACFARSGSLYRYYEVLDELFSGGPISLRVESWGRPKLSDSSYRFNFSYLFAASGRMSWSSLWYYEVLGELFSGGPISLRAESSGRPELSDSSSRFNLSYLFAASGRMTWSSLCAEIFHWSCIKQLKHYMLASPVSHLSAASDVFLVFCIVPYRDHQRFLESSPSHKVFKSKMRNKCKELLDVRRVEVAACFARSGSLYRYYEVLDELFSGGPISLRVESWGGQNNRISALGLTYLIFLRQAMGVWPPPLLSFSSRQVLRSPRRAVLGWANIFKSGVIGEAKIIGFQLSVQLVLSFCGKRSDDLVKPLVNGNGSAVSALLRLDRVCV
ncbi:hypothetical protein F2Q68_00034873 [Brassica cretica]|uniref:Uncharacterized protein n=1 Tax=Brassica cretica TaxID=69181 RepID=A0A8S9H577_BRACR|nr:hypothetical protein F2Q68_00034873 [Brassica cretica]